MRSVMEQYLKLKAALMLFETYGINNVIDYEIGEYGDVEYKCAFFLADNDSFEIEGVIIDDTIIQKIIITNDMGDSTFIMNILKETKNLSIECETREILEQKYNMMKQKRTNPYEKIKMKNILG